MYVFCDPSEKKEMFLNIPFRRNSAALSGLSDERHSLWLKTTT
ncbi:hypothetical protein F240042I4_03040 [Eisenbergiella tayi]